MLAAIGVDPDEGRGRPGPLRLLLVVVATTGLSLVVLGVFAFALEGKELERPEPAPPPIPVVVDAGPLRTIALPEAVHARVTELVAACHLSASPRDPSLRAAVDIDVEIDGGAMVLGDASGASPFFHGCLRRRAKAEQWPAELRGRARLRGEVRGGRANLR